MKDGRLEVVQNKSDGVNKLEEYRLRKGYTQKYIAEEILNISYPTYYRKLNGNIGFKTEEMKALKELLDIPLDDFYDIFFN